MKYVCFDIETTGLSVSNDRIVEIGAVKVEIGEIISTFSKLINPGIPMPFEASNINGITDEMFVDKPLPGQVLAEFNHFIQGVDFLVGHNAQRFDYPFLLNEFKRYYVSHEKYPLKDTAWLSRHKLRDLRSHSLKSLCNYFGLVNENAHRALDDAKVTQEIFERIYRR